MQALSIENDFKLKYANPEMAEFRREKEPVN